MKVISFLKAAKQLSEEAIGKLKKEALKNRIKIIEMIYRGGAGHPGGSLSVVDVLTALYAADVHLDEAPRSRVVLSKGHAVPALYAVLHSHGRVQDAELSRYRQLDSRLQGHPSSASLPEVDATTGLLGQGLSIGTGMAVAKKARKDPTHVWVIAGDGELHEGQNWEAALQAAHFHLDNLTLFVDHNGLSSSGRIDEVIGLGDLEAKFSAFGFEVETIDGHDMGQILKAMDRALTKRKGPRAVILRTVKGKGVSFMENEVAWHGGSISAAQYEQAMRELSAAEREG